jgi:integrase
MSPRPQLAIGDYGHISYSRSPDGKWVAMARYRDVDGETRRVKAQGGSRGAAESALKAKFRGRAKSAGGVELDGESRVSELAEKYWAAKQEDGLAANTLYNLRLCLDNHIVPKLGKFRIREVSPQVVEKLVRDVTREHGPGASFNVRSKLSGMFTAAVRWGAASMNPVGYVPVPKQARKPIRALTVAEVVAMRDYAVERLKPYTYEERFERANGDTGRMGGKNRGQLPLDVMHFLLATGCRAGEVLGLAWEDVHLDAPEPWVEIRQQVVREPGNGLQLRPTKEHDIRRLRLRGVVLEMLRERRATATGPMVFHTGKGNLLAPRNVARAWAATFKDSEWSWVTQKTLRKTVATLVDEAHGSVLASKQLGHASDGVTRRHYIAQSLTPIDTGEALEIFGT